MAYQPMAKSNKTQYAILGMLSIEPMSGYAIRQLIQQSTANFWSESDGQLYPALASLTKQGLITCKATETVNPREKKVYRITSAGKAELKNWLAQESEKQIVRSEFMLKLFFGANVAPEINLEHVQAYRYRIKSRLAQLLETQKQIKQEDSPHLPYWLMSIDYGIKLAETQLEWCKDVIHALEKMKYKFLNRKDAEDAKKSLDIKAFLCILCVFAVHINSRYLSEGLYISFPIIYFLSVNLIMRFF